ncbi:MAG: DNA-directed RNA polymerase subunit alpha [Chlamydiota bacterium]|nr:DNA-directed RNA polymerase subunit alpha [Chlamydiota bacterium]
MTVKYHKFVLPKSIQIDEVDEITKSRCQVFTVSPLERGFGHTLGHLLRRVLMSALESPAILYFAIEEVAHEYTAIPGIVEDMTHIVLNMKEARIIGFKDHQNEEVREFTHQLVVTEEEIKKAGGAVGVTLGRITEDQSVEIVNADHHLFTATAPLQKKIVVGVARGRGYIPSDRSTLERRLGNEIILDRSHSPIERVVYRVENTRVEQDTDLDRLVLEVETDGRITPEEALGFAVQIVMQHLLIFKELSYENVIYSEEERIDEDSRSKILEHLCKKVDQIELSVRAANCLSGAGKFTIGELVLTPESEMLKFKNFGRKSLDEIKSKLKEYDLSLGMNLEKFGINQDNIHELMKDHQSDELQEE